MDYNKLVTIVGKGGVFEILTQRPDGLIVKSLVDQKSQFVSSRLHHFTLLENISIYTETDNIPISDIFLVMHHKKADHAVPESKDGNDALKAYFEKIQPDYDRERVYVSDIKKIIKWFAILEQHEMAGLLDAKSEEE